MTLSPNTPITQENVGLLKAGDWLRCSYWNGEFFTAGRDYQVLGLEHGVPVLLSDLDHRERVHLFDQFTFAPRPALAKPAEGEGVVERVRSWSQPGPEWLQSKEHTYNTLPEWSRQIPATPTPPSVDWSVVGPKLVEALEKAATWLDDLADVAGSERARAGSHKRWRHDTVKDWARRTRSAAALAAAQPEGK